MNHTARKKKEGNIRFDTQTQPNLNLSLNSSESLRWPLRLYWTATLVYVCVPAIRAEYCKFNWLRLVVVVVVAVAFAPARAIIFEIHTLSHTQRETRALNEDNIHDDNCSAFFVRIITSSSSSSSIGLPSNGGGFTKSIIGVVVSSFCIEKSSVHSAKVFGNFVTKYRKTSAAASAATNNNERKQ